MKPLFDINAKVKDRAYINIRDGKGPHEVAARQLAEKLWIKYYPYADRHFLVEIRKEFHTRFWEMYLACTLMENKYKISHTDEGPDLKVEDNTTNIWIEAVTPTSGALGNPDSVPSMKMLVAQEVPDDQIILRYRSVINDKYFDKYFKYIDNGIINNDDCYIIALNGRRIPWYGSDYEPPRIVRSVLPFGSQVVTFDTRFNAVVDRSIQYRPFLSKASGSQVDTDIFLRQEYEHISAVMFSNVDVANPTPVMGDDFIIVHNPLALRPLPDNFPNVGWEYKAQVSETTITLLPKILSRTDSL